MRFVLIRSFAKIRYAERKERKKKQCCCSSFPFFLSFSVSSQNLVVCVGGGGLDAVKIAPFVGSISRLYVRGIYGARRTGVLLANPSLRFFKVL